MYCETTNTSVAVDLSQYPVSVYLAESFMGIIANTVFLLIVVRGVHAERLPKILYLFLGARAFSDFSSSLLSLVMCVATLLYFSLPPELLVRAALATITANVYRGVALYCGLTATILFSIYRPIAYQRRVRARCCLKLIAVGWLVCSLFGLVHFVPTRVVCGAATTEESCRSFVRDRILFGASVLLVFYCSTLAFFGFVALKALHLRKEYRKSFQNCRQNCRPPSVLKLGLAVISFGLFYLPVLVDRFFLVRFYDNCIPFGGHLCYSAFPHPYSYHFVLLRAVVDPLVALVADSRLLTKVSETAPQRRQTVRVTTIACGTVPTPIGP